MQKETTVQPKHKSGNAAKPLVMRWLDYPSHSPELGEEIVVCYGDNAKKEVVTWKLKFVGSELKFKWIRLPAIA